MSTFPDKASVHGKPSAELPVDISDEQMQGIISALPEEKQELLIRRVQALMVAKSHCGPIPSPQRTLPFTIGIYRTGQTGF